MEKFHLPNSDKCLIDQENCSGGGGVLARAIMKGLEESGFL